MNGGFRRDVSDSPDQVFQRGRKSSVTELDATWRNPTWNCNEHENNCLYLHVVSCITTLHENGYMHKLVLVEKDATSYNTCC